MGILSVQSQVSSGFVGNSVASFALQRLGHEVWSVPTVLLSNHPGHRTFQGGPITDDLKVRLFNGLSAIGCFTHCEAVISGYLSGIIDSALIAKALGQAKATGECIFLCDPVLGDDGITYVSDEVVSAVRRLIPLADIVTPNAYELSLLCGFPLDQSSAALRAMRILQGKGPDVVFLTSFIGTDTPMGKINTFILDRAGCWKMAIPKLAQKFSGTGDLLAALFLHFWLTSRDSPQAMANSCAVLFEVLQKTMSLGSSELAIIEAQDQLLSPGFQFDVEPLA